jgi:hypothetical protein
MKDFLGKELEIGDLVVVTEPKYRNLVKAKIVAFTPKKVRIEYRSYLGRNYTYLSEPDFLVLYQKFEWPNVCHESHKNVRSSDASTFDFICDVCGATDQVPGGWGSLRKPCEGVK